MKYLIALLFSFTFILGQAQEGIEFFHGTFDEAKEQAEKEGKLIFMDAYTTWCGPCKRMAAKVFPDKTVGEFFNRNFINLKMDMEKGEGKTLRKTYKVSAYPTLLFLSSNGDVVYETKGARDANGLIALGKKALLPNESDLRKLETQWNDGDRDVAFLQKYIKVKAALGEDYNEALQSYIDNMNDDLLSDEANGRFILDHANQVNSPALEVVLNNKKYFENTFGDAVADLLAKVGFQSAKAAIKEGNKDLFNEALAFMKKMKTTNYKEEGVLLQSLFYGKNKDWEQYDKVVTKIVKKYKSDDDVALREFAWNYYMNYDGEAELRKAEKWAASSVELNNTYENNLTQAYLLYKLGEYSDAQDAVEYAIILAGESKKKTKNAEILRDQIYTELEAQKE